MIEKLRDKYNRRAVAILLILLATLLIVALWQLNANKTRINPISPILFDFSQNLITSILITIFTTLFIGFLYFYLLPREKKLTQLEEVDPQTTIEYFDAALKQTTFWGYHGHIGRWVRNAAIPALIRNAQERGETINVCVILIDPNNFELCDAFQRYKNSIRFREHQGTDHQSISAIEIYTTITKCLYYKQTYNLNIEVYLANHFSALRKDISDSMIFMTRVDPRAPAIIIRKPSDNRPIEMMFSVLRTEFEFTKQTSKKLNFDDSIPLVTANPTSSIIRDVLTRLSILDGNLAANDTFLEAISKRFLSDYHPYN